MLKRIVVGLLIVTAFSRCTKSDSETVHETVTQKTIEEHIYYLASDEMKGRETGSPEIDQAADYLMNSLKAYGVQPVPGATDGYFQDVDLEVIQPASSKEFSVGDLITNEVLVMSGVNVNTSREAVFVGYGLEEDYENVEVNGMLVVALNGTSDANDINSSVGSASSKLELAQAKGAMGLIELNSFEEDSWSRVSNYFGRSTTKARSEENNDFLHLWVRDADEAFLNMVKKGGQTVGIILKGMSRTPMAARNVVGMVEGSDPELKDEFVIYSAHYDHIGVGRPNAEGDSIYNGARDNAVGTVTVLSAAENIAKYPTKRSALFILFTAEEKGLLGSKWYADNPLIPMNQMVFCFNSDNGGYNDTTVATIVGLERTTAGYHIKAACQEFGLEAIDDPAGEQGLFDRSDNVSFARKGVPAPTYSLGFTAFDEEIQKYYHQAGDHADNLDYEYLTKFFKSYVLSSRSIANDTVTPFWVEGDKYHPVGVSLYDKN